MSEETCLQQITLETIIENSTCPMCDLGPELRGVVYAISGPVFSRYSELFKIGYTKSLIHRIPQLVRHMGGDIWVHGIVWTDDPQYLETIFHELWYDQNIPTQKGREWFKLTDQQLAWFKSLGTINTWMVKGYIEEPEDLVEWLQRERDDGWF